MVEFGEARGKAGEKTAVVGKAGGRYAVEPDGDDGDGTASEGEGGGGGGDGTVRLASGSDGAAAPATGGETDAERGQRYARRKRSALVTDAPAVPHAGTDGRRGSLPGQAEEWEDAPPAATTVDELVAGERAREALETEREVALLGDGGGGPLGFLAR